MVSLPRGPKTTEKITHLWVIRTLPPSATIGLQRNSTEEETVSSLNLVRWGGFALLVGVAYGAVAIAITSRTLAGILHLFGVSS